MASPNIEGTQNAQTVSGGVFGTVIQAIETPAIVTGSLIVQGSISSQGSDASGYSVQYVGASGTTGAPNASIALKTSRGTVATPVPTVSGDVIGNIDYFGYDVNGYAYAAAVDIVAAGAFTATSTPTTYNLNLTPVNTIVPVNVFSVSNTGNISLPQIGGIVGSNGTTSASAGQVGEVIQSQVLAASPVSLSTGVVSNITSITLTAGDWEVEGVVDYAPAATTSLALLNYGSSSTTAALGPQDTYGADFYGAVTGAVVISEVVPKTRYLITAPTVVYLVASASFTVSTCTAYGKIYARRAR